MNNEITPKNAKRKILIESAVVFFIALSPLLYKLYDYLPENPEATITLFGMTIDRNGFPDVSTYAWFMMSKLIPLYLMVFWFLTSKNWWYHIILIPIAMYSFQVFEVLFDSDNNIDTENIWWLLPICMVVIPFVYFIRIKLYDKHVHGIDLEAMEAELKALQEQQASDDMASITSDTEVQPLETEQYVSLSEKIDRQLSTRNLFNLFKRFRHSLQSWL